MADDDVNPDALFDNLDAFLRQVMKKVEDNKNQFAHTAESLQHLLDEYARLEEQATEDMTPKDPGQERVRDDAVR